MVFFISTLCCRSISVHLWVSQCVCKLWQGCQRFRYHIYTQTSKLFLTYHKLLIGSWFFYFSNIKNIFKNYIIVLKIHYLLVLLVCSTSSLAIFLIQNKNRFKRTHCQCWENYSEIVCTLRTQIRHVYWL